MTPLSRKDLFALLLLASVNIAPVWSSLPDSIRTVCLVSIITRAFLELRVMASGAPGIFRKLLLLVALLGLGTRVGLDLLATSDRTVSLLATFVACLFYQRPNQRTAVGMVLACYGLMLAATFPNGHQPLSENLAIFSLADFLLASSILYLVHYPEGSSQYIFSLVRNVLKLGLITAGLLAVLIGFFPRLSMDLFTIKAPPAIGFGSGNEINPAAIDELASSELPAFRARFLGELPRASQLYWRGTTLSLTVDGFHWYRVAVPRDPHPRAQLARSGDLAAKSIDQEILLEPRFEHLVFALDTPLDFLATRLKSGPSPLRGAGQVFSVRDLPNQRELYRATSVSEPTYDHLPDEARKAYLQPPQIKDLRITALAARLKDGDPEAKRVAGRLLIFFRQGFRYRLDPGKHADESRPGAALGHFLFEKREGFCGHFATAFATMMRLAGVPARVVMGFHGGEANHFDGTWLIRDLDAHAWVEVWSDEDHRWLRYDPTSVVAPMRLVMGARAYRTRFQESNSWLSRFGHWGLAWEALTTEWSFYRLGGHRSLGRNSRRIEALIAWPVAILSILILAAAGWWWRKRRRRTKTSKRDEVGELFEKFCFEMQRLGIRRERAEGPRDFMERCEAQLPGFAGLPREFTRRFIELRYARPAEATRKVKELRRVYKTLKKQAGAFRKI